MTDRPGRNFGGGRQFGGTGPAPAAPEPPVGPVRPVLPDEDPVARLLRSPVARITEPAPVRVRPEMEGDVARYTALGLAYQPQLSAAHARVVATRLAEWSYEDPELRALIEDDFTKAVTSAGDSWWMRGDSVTETLWSEAVDLVDAVAGEEYAQRRRRLSEDRDLAAATGAVDPAERLAEKPPQEKEQWSWRTVAAGVNDILAGSGPGAVFLPFRVLGIGGQLEDLEEAQSQIVAASEARAREMWTPEMIVADAGRQMFVDGEVASLEEGVNYASSILASLPQEEQDRILAETRSMTAKELAEEWTPPPDDETAIDRGVGATLGGALELAQTWDAVAQSLGIFFTSAISEGGGLFPNPASGGLGLAGGAASVLAGTAEEPEGDIGAGGPFASLTTEGFDAFKRDWEATKEGGIAAYYGLDPNSALGGWINLGSSILFDPTTWIVPGGATVARRGADMMSSPAGAERFLRTRRGRSLVRGIAETDDPRSLAPFLHGMSGEARRTLLHATDETVVADTIRNEITNGTWLMNGPALGAFHQSILSAEKVGEKLGDNFVGRAAVEFLRRQPAKRAVSVGESSFLDDATEIIIARYPNDPDLARAALDDVYTRFDDYMSGSEQLLNERVLSADQLRAQSAQISRSVTSEVRRIPQARAALRDVDVQLRQAERRAAALQREFDAAVPIGDEVVEQAADLPARISELDTEITTLTNQREALEAWVNRFGGTYDEWRGARADLMRQRQNLRRANLEASKPRSRASLAQWYDEFMAGWADDIGVPRDEAGEIMWEKVSGRKSVGGASENAARQAPFGVMEDVARALGFGDTGSQHWLPVTPYEMAMYRGASRAGKILEHNKAIAGIGNFAADSFNFLNRLWAANLLFNPLNAGKAHIEDVYKFAVSGAPAGQVARALVSPAKSAANRLGANNLAKVLPGADNPRSSQFVRQTIAGLETRRSAWEVVQHGEKGHFEASRRWLEGTLLQNDGFRVWARSVRESDPAIWNEWWDEVGKLKVRTPVIPVPGTGAKMSILGADEAALSMRSVVDELANLSSNPAEFRDTLVRLAADGKDRVPEAIARMAGPVPVERGTMSTAGKVSMGSGFDFLYGAPARARGGVFFEHFYDNAMSILEKRWEGRIIDDQLELLVQKGFAQSVEEAQWLLAIRNPQVDDLLRRSGMVTRGFLEQTASNYAGKHAQSLMYLGGSPSIAGRGFAKVAPFAPAQFDFLGWWSRQITATNDLVESGATETVSRMIGGALERMGAPGAGGAVARVGERVAQRGPIPLNTRLLSRWSHLVAQSGQTEREHRAGLNPISLISNWTFLPVDFSDPENFLVDFVPGLGPLPSWMLNLLPPDHPVSVAAKSVSPSLDWIGERASLDPESLVKYFLPATTRSLTGLVGWVGRGAASVDALDDFVSGTLGMLGPLVDWQRRPYGQTDLFKQSLGDLLAENPHIAVGSPEYAAMVAEASRSSTQEANGAESRSRLMRYVGLSSDFGADGQNLLHYRGLVDELDRLAELGIVGEAQRDQLKDWWPQVESGDAPRELLNLFGDQAASLLFDLPDEQRSLIIALHPELAVNMVSTVRAVKDRYGNYLAPADLVRPDGRIDMTSPQLRGEAGGELRARGFREGWFDTRPDDEVAADVFAAYHRARWDTLKNLWETFTGREYASGMTKQLERTVFMFTPEHVALFDRMGVAINQSMTGAEFRDSIRAVYNQVSVAQKEAEKAGNTSPDENAFWVDVSTKPDYAPLWQEVEAVRDRLDDPDIGVTTMWEWPEQTKAWLRERIAATIATDPSMLESYNQFLRPALGPLDWEPPQPPPVSGLEKAIEVESRYVSVEDGDTLRLATADGDIRVRIIGLNAPEQGQEGYSEAWDRLAAILDGAGTVTIGRYRSDLFPVVEDVDVGEQRIFGWLYVDGVPLYDPSVFTATNQTGAEVGGDVSDLTSLLAAERERMARGNGSG